MKQTQIDALLRAHHGRVQVVASLHILTQPSLEADDHTFLQEHVGELGNGELLRWLARCREMPRMPVIRAIAKAVCIDPHWARVELLGGGERILSPDDWAELYELSRGAAADVAHAMLSRTTGCSIYRALVEPPRPIEPSTLDPVMFGVDRADAASLPARIARAFAEPSGLRPLSLARALFGSRHDERTCRRLINLPAPDPTTAASHLYQLDRAGLLARLDNPEALFPAETSFLCEAPSRHDDEALRDAFVRHLSLSFPVTEGKLASGWYCRALVSAVDRGVSWRELLRETPEAVRLSIPAFSEATRARICREAEGLALPAAITVRHLVPWAVDEASLRAIAQREATSSDESWAPQIEAFPVALAEAVRERARRTTNDEEHTSLLEWLRRHGYPRKALLDIAIARLAQGKAPAASVAWVARQLDTRAAWEQHGNAAVEALLSAGRLTELSELITMSWSEAARQAGAQPPGEAPNEQLVPVGFREAIHFALGSVLLKHARAALDGGDIDLALSMLSSLVLLDPPARLARALHELGKRDGLPPSVRELAQVNKGLVRRSDGRDATLQGAIAAVHALADSQRRD